LFAFVSPIVFLQKFAFSSCAKGKPNKQKNADTDEASGGLIG